MVEIRFEGDAQPRVSRYDAAPIPRAYVVVGGVLVAVTLFWLVPLAVMSAKWWWNLL